MEENKDYLRKWLHTLFLVKVGALAASCLSVVSSLSPIALSPILVWVNRIISAGLIFVFFQLGKVHGSYQKAAVFYAIALVGNLIGSQMAVSILTLLASICGIFAQYREFDGNSEITKPLDEALSQKWHSLFYWQLGVSTVTGIVPIGAVLIAVSDGVDTEMVTFAVALFIAAVSGVFSLIYLKYLKRTQALFTD